MSKPRFLLNTFICVAAVVGFGSLKPKAETNRGNEFQTLQTPRPCEQPVYRELDFWVGEWDVFAGGKKVGTNRIEKILSGCVIFENWTDAAGNSGKSFNTFNRQKGKWQQTWIDDRGGVLEFTGTAKEGVMSYEAETPGKDGAKTLHRMTFTKLSENRVRQLWEQSVDSGKTWKTVFDGDYQRKI